MRVLVYAFTLVMGYLAYRGIWIPWSMVLAVFGAVGCLLAWVP